MKNTALILGGVVVVLGLAAAAYMVDIDQTEQASLPDVDVSVQGGNLPEFEAEVGSISVTEETATVPVPDVDVSVDQAEVSVPGIEITPPEDDAEIASN